MRKPSKHTRLISSPNLWATISREANRDGAKRLAVAYVSSLEGLSLRDGDVLIADVSEKAVAQGQTNALVLQAAARQGVAIYTHPGLHAKVYLLPRCAIVGSPNLSASSRALTEAAIVNWEEDVRVQIGEWFKALRGHSKRLTERALSRLCTIPVRVPARGRGRIRPTLLELLERDSPALDDFVYSWATEGVKFSEKSVEHAASERGIIPPGISRRNWTWEEWEESPGLAKALERAYAGRLCVCFWAKLGSQKLIGRITDLEPTSGAYLDTVPLGRVGGSRGLIASVHTLTPGVRLSGTKWPRLLCRTLTRGLQRQTDLNTKISHRRTSAITPVELRLLFRAGSQGV